MPSKYRTRNTSTRQMGGIGYGLVYIHTAECGNVDDVGHSLVLMIHAPSYLYRKIIPLSKIPLKMDKRYHGNHDHYDDDYNYNDYDELFCLNLETKTTAKVTALEHANLYEAMFGTSDVECEYSPPRGRQDKIDEKDGHITAVREFVEETRGLYHPYFPYTYHLPTASLLKSSSKSESELEPVLSRITNCRITDCWVGLDNKMYAYEYIVYVDDKDRLLRCGYEDLSLARFIVNYLYGHSVILPNSLVIQYMERFKYVHRHDATTHVCYIYLKDCISKWMTNRIVTLIPPDLSLLCETVKKFLIKKYEEKRETTHHHDETYNNGSETSKSNIREKFREKYCASQTVGKKIT